MTASLASLATLAFLVSLKRFHRHNLLLSCLCLGLFCLPFVLVLETISGSRPGGPVQALLAPWRGVDTIVLDLIKALELLWIFVLSRPWMLRLGDLALLTLALLALDTLGEPGPGKRCLGLAQSLLLSFLVSLVSLSLM